MKIEYYSFGSIRVDGRTYTSDLIIFPDRIIDRWRRVEGHSLAVEDLGDVLACAPRILIVGRGAFGCMKISSVTREFLEKKGIELIDGKTADMVSVFNDKAASGERPIGAFHLTC